MRERERNRGLAETRESPLTHSLVNHREKKHQEFIYISLSKLPAATSFLLITCVDSEQLRIQILTSNNKTNTKVMFTHLTNSISRPWLSGTTSVSSRPFVITLPGLFSRPKTAGGAALHAGLRLRGPHKALSSCLVRASDTATVSSYTHTHTHTHASSHTHAYISKHLHTSQNTQPWTLIYTKFCLNPR